MPAEGIVCRRATANPSSPYDEHAIALISFRPSGTYYAVPPPSPVLTDTIPPNATHTASLLREFPVHVLVTISLVWYHLTLLQQSRPQKKSPFPHRSQVSRQMSVESPNGDSD